MKKVREMLANKEGPRHRTPDHATSIAGAVDVAKRAPNQKIRLLVEYAEAGAEGLTDEEAAERAGLSVRSSFWKRCGELRQLGYTAQPEGKPTRKGAAGVPRIISVITPEGRQKLKELGQ